jgi:Aspartyl protease
LPIVECGFLNVPLPPSITPQAALIATGPGILVDIGFDAAILSQVAAGTIVQVPANPNVRQVLALIDTGASESCIDETLAQQLQLPLVNQQQTGGVGGGSYIKCVPSVYIDPILGNCASWDVYRRSAFCWWYASQCPHWPNTAC